MSFCSQCGCEIELRFCRRCGAPNVQSGLAEVADSSYRVSISPKTPSIKVVSRFIIDAINSWAQVVAWEQAAAAFAQLQSQIQEINQQLQNILASPNASPVTGLTPAQLQQAQNFLNSAADNVTPDQLIVITNLTLALSTRILQTITSQLQNDLDSDNEISEMTTMRLQMLMDTRSKLLQTASDIEKSISDTNMAIAGNIKQ